MFKEAKELYESGLSIRNVSIELNVTYEKIRMLFNNNDYSCRSPEENSLIRKKGIDYRRTRRTWNSMHYRCNGEKEYNKYKYYGGKGITVCGRWDSFDNFLEDMGYKPDGLTLDRKDNSKGYYKDNCKWSTQKEQCNNRDTNIIMTLNGKQKTLPEWCCELKLNKGTVRARLYRSWSDEEALLGRQRKRLDNIKLLTYDGVEQSVKEWADKLKISKKGIYKRLREGCSVKESLFNRKRKVPCDTKLLTFKGVSQTIKEWSSELEIPERNIRSRIKLGWQVGEILELE
jgi:hypothetical protein